MNQYLVICYPDKHRRGKPRKVFVRASSSEKAAKIGRSVSGRRVTTVLPYEPWRDAAFGRFIQMVEA